MHHGFDRVALAARATRAGLNDIVFSTVFEIVKETEAGARAYPVCLMLARRS